eukprot:c12783_g1_i1 orf=337-897(-)
MRSVAVFRSARRLFLQGRGCGQGAVAQARGFRTFVEKTSPASQALPSTSCTHTQRRHIRREPISQAQRQAEMEEEARRVDLDPAKCLKKGDPGTVQGIIKDVIPVGYWVTMPSGKDGYLPATDLGITGGVVLLERLMKVGQEITVRVDSIGGGGREILSMKRPECVPVINDRFGFANLSRNSTRKV